jgi:SH3 domain-containing YSC84-like protein 1
MRMEKKLIVVLLCVIAAAPAIAEKADKRLVESTLVLRRILAKNDIPKALLNKAECVMVYPNVKKVDLDSSGTGYGRGVLVCRAGPKMDGDWGAPIMYTLDTGSLGAQIGSSTTDYLLLVMSQRGADMVLSGKLELGAGASAVAGPSGENAGDFNYPSVDVLSYSQSEGLLAGASLGGASMEADDDMNRELYGKDIDAGKMVRDGQTPVPPAARLLIAALRKASPNYM